MTNPFFCYGKGLRLTGTWTRRAGVVQRHSAGSDREADNTLASPLAHRRVDHPHQEQLEVQTAGARKPAPPVILTATELPSPLLASTSELAADPNDPVVTKDARNIPVFSPASSRAAAQDLVGDSTPSPPPIKMAGSRPPDSLGTRDSADRQTPARGATCLVGHAANAADTAEQ